MEAEAAKLIGAGIAMSGMIGARQELAEDVADADAGADHAAHRDAGADELGGFCFHGRKS